MKVVILAPTPPPSGGIAGWTMRMKNSKLKNNWKVEVVDEKLIGNREVFGKTKKNLFNEIKRSVNIWKMLYKALKDKEAKVVHSCIPASTTGMIREYICCIITKIFKRKFIIHYRCTIPNMIKTKLGLFVFRALTNISDLVFVLNIDSLNYVKKHTNTDVSLVPNFIEDSEIISTNTKTIENSIKKILYIGGVVETKGCCDIIKVAEKFSEIEFRLVGNVDQKIIDMEKSSNVILLGEKSKVEVKQELENADVFMFVSYFEGEGFSNALAEAMAYGLPCIVTDWAANKDMIENEGGIVVSIKDTDSMICAINKLKNDRHLRKAQSNWNIKKVKLNYTSDVVTSKYVDEYERITRNI